MSTKSAAIVAAFTGALAPANHQFEVVDPMKFTTITVDGMASGDVINVRRQDFGGTGFEPYTKDGKIVQLNASNTTFTPAKAGIYGLEGVVVGPITIYTEEVT